MENTVEALLGHGDKAPQLLLDKLKNGQDGSSTNNNTSMDEQLARQLSSRGGAAAAAPSTGAAPSSSSSPPPPTSSAGSSYMANYTPRGTPTSLADDFLRVPTSSAQSTMDSDEALARMLQDQLFSEELRRNPDFAHLAGRPRVSNVSHQSAGTARTSFAARNGQQQPLPLPNIMEKLSGR